MSSKNPGHVARKRFGQNFLHDPTIIGRIISAINPKPEEHLVEIGPGLGALTAMRKPPLTRAPWPIPGAIGRS